MLIVNPTFEGYFSSMLLLKCEGILSTEDVARFYSTIKLNDTSDEKYILACFATKKFKLKSISISTSPCKGAYDSKYGRDCHCIKQQNFTGNVLSFNFQVKDYGSLEFKPITSLRLTKAFVHNNVIDSGFEESGKIKTRENRQHAQAELQGKTLTFFVWCKPVKKEDSDIFYLTKANISRVEIEGSISKYQFPSMHTMSTEGGAEGVLAGVVQASLTGMFEEVPARAPVGAPEGTPAGASAGASTGASAGASAGAPAKTTRKRTKLV